MKFVSLLDINIYRLVFQKYDISNLSDCSRKVYDILKRKVLKTKQKPEFLRNCSRQCLLS